jgi:hypothetical protein
MIATAILLAVLSREAGGEPTHLQSSSTVHTDGGVDLRLPPGYFLPEPDWSKLDVEMRRLQDQETRLNAQNQALRSDLEHWQPGWVTLVGAAVLGGALGWYAHSKL